MQELGIPWRLYAVVLRRAFGLWTRIQLLSLDHTCRKVAEVAAVRHSSWTAVMHREAEELVIPLPRQWAARDEDLSRAASRRLAKRYLHEVVDLAIGAREEAWIQSELLKHPLRGACRLIDVLDLAIPAASMRAWAQLRLQGQLTVKGSGPLRASSCPACGGDVRPDWRHLVTACPVLEPTVTRSIADTPWESLRPAELATVLEHPRQTADIERAIWLSGTLRSAVASVSRG